ncbi:MAG TPA: hypothetical protein VMV92_15560 [Streptosporangiaceae bacterium]|nr:hypothetical protein [Streptosporangiaceae bacterium]
MWLYRDDFRAVGVEFGWEMFTGRVMAAVDFEALAGALDAGESVLGSEGQMLRLAASIAAGVPVDLGGAVTGLDAASIGLVAGAVLHAAGRRDPSVVAACGGERR